MASESSSELEIPVLVKGTEKWVTGLTKRTTCDDVIYALLYQDGLQDREHTSAYAIFEKWREVERPLQGRTKIVKIWRTWGAEQSNVHLSMRRIDEMEYSGEFSLTRRKKRSRHKTRDRERERDRERSSREHRRHHHGYCQSASERLRSMETLVKLVISQERKLKDLIEHADDTDKLIDKYESRVHTARLKQDGKDYVKEAYLEGRGEDSMEDFFSNLNVEQLEIYVEYCDKVIALEDKIVNEQSKIEDLSCQIQQCVDRNSDEHGSLSDHQDYTSVQAELNRAVSCAIMQQYKCQDIQREIQFYEDKYHTKEELCNRLQKELEDGDAMAPTLVDRTSDIICSSVNYSEHVHNMGSTDSLPSKPYNPLPVPERNARNPVYHQYSSSPTFPDTKPPPPVPSRTRRQPDNNVNVQEPHTDKHSTTNNEQITNRFAVPNNEPVANTYALPNKDTPPERKPILKQTSEFRNGYNDIQRPNVNSETKVRFNTESLIDKYNWEDSSLSEGISMDHSDCSDSKDLFDYSGKDVHIKRDNYTVSKHGVTDRSYVSGVADRPYLTVKVEDNDSNSDTGLSSMHSDDSAVYHLETLV